jgi:hypothetical protein
LQINSKELRRVASAAQQQKASQLSLQLSLLCRGCAAIEASPRDKYLHSGLQETDWGKSADGQTEMWFYRCKGCRAVWLREMNLPSHGSTWKLREMPPDQTQQARDVTAV